jgi:hypothetical protein
MRPAGDILIVCRFYGLACRDGLFHNRIIARERRRPTRAVMKIDDVRRTAYSMPLTNPSFPPGPYRFFNREYFIITYRTDMDAHRAAGQIRIHPDA